MTAPIYHKGLMVLLAGLFALLIDVSLVYANGETLYVRPGGGTYGTENGTSYANAFDGFLDIVYNAANTAGQVDPGDKLYVCGEHTTQQMEIYQDGTSPLHIDIDFGCPNDTGSIHPTSSNFALYVEASYIDVHGGDFSGGALGTVMFPTNGGVEANVSGSSFYSNTVHDSVHATAELVGYYGTDITIRDNVLYNGKNDGIFSHGGVRATITGNTISRISTVGTGGDCVQLSFTVNDSLVANNSCDHTNVDSKYCWISSAVTDAGQVTYRGNTCVRNSTDTVGSGLYNETNALIVSNTFTGGQYGIQCANATTLRCDVTGNVVLNANQVGIITGSTTDAATLSNNTIIGATTGIRIDANAAGVILQNNILQGQVTGINKLLSGGAPQDTYNLFYATSGNALVVNGTPTSPGGGSVLATDPLFVGGIDYRTLGNSPVRRSGSPSTTICKDRRGRPCWAPPDIGAYQATSGDPAAIRTERN